MYLLDTCFLSELIKKDPNPKVVEWLQNQCETSLFLSVLTVGEIAKGISNLDDLKKQEKYLKWLNHDLKDRFYGRLLTVDEKVALLWGNLTGNLKKRGVSLSVIDGMLCATALTYNLTLVTRNTKDCVFTDVPLLNPWE